MSTEHFSAAELKRMTLSELRKELSVKRADAAKMRLGLTMQKEKNSALYRRLKADIARILFVVSGMEKGGKSTDREVPKAEESPSQKPKKSVKDSSSPAAPKRKRATAPRKAA